jgi:hypothetical protein
MKKFTIVFTIITAILLGGRLLCAVHAQDSAKDDAPTFYRLVPGTYVNGWPRFTVHYPKEWVEYRPQQQVVFRVGAPDFSERLLIDVGSPYPLEKMADISVLSYKNIGAKDVTVLSDKPSQLRDGTPAREVELKMVFREGPPAYSFYLGTKKGDMPQVGMSLISTRVIGKDQKAIPYSLQYEPGKDEPLKVPPDIQEFLDRYRNDVLSHDLQKVMALYSDGYLSSGNRKGEAERVWRSVISAVTSFEVGITDFVAAGDKAYLAGFTITNGSKYPLPGNSITLIKENGEWKIFGNQRNPPPSPPPPS